MGTVFDYLDWRGDLSFTEAPLNEVDCLLFSLISYVNFYGIVPPDLQKESGVSIRAAANAFASRYPDPKKFSMGILLPKDIIKVLKKAKTTRRFRNVEMQAYTNIIDTQREMQFSAVTFFPGDGSAVVAFRGTDDTLVGWKEDLNMCFLPVVPAQEESVRYLAEVAKNHKGPLICTGHSKGGNLAVYAAVHSEKSVRKRIVHVYNNDGPGFGRSLELDHNYLEMKPAIRNLVPQSSLVGMLLEHGNDYTVVKSRQTGLLQHDGLSWEILGDSFVKEKELSKESKRTDRTVNQWIRDMTPEQREELAQAIYQLFSVEGAKTLTDLVAARKKWLAHSKQLDPKVHEIIQKTLSMLISINTKTLFGGVGKKTKASVGE